MVGYRDRSRDQARKFFSPADFHANEAGKLTCPNAERMISGVSRDCVMRAAVPPAIIFL